MKRPLPHIYPFLLPIACIYGCIVELRNFLFDMGILHARCFKLPIISVGNLTVGGTGKTPHIEYMIRLLQDKWHVAVLSRGYKRSTKGYLRCKAHSTVEDVGDEPYQMAHKYPQVMVAVDANRVEGVQKLLSDPPTANTDIILLDDAYQHRRIKPGLNILLMDFNRAPMDDYLLPAGRLREPFSRKDRADIIIVTKCPTDLSDIDRNKWLMAINAPNSTKVFFSTVVYGSIYPLFSNVTQFEWKSEAHILLLTGIVNPNPIVEHIKQYCQNIHQVVFPDHHHFTAEELKEIELQFYTLPYPRYIITTEKDAARLKHHMHLSEALKSQVYVLPIEIAFLFDEEKKFNQNILAYVTENSRNSSLPQG